jgi:predicted Holliday junction resolvase-like endonuclease
MAAQAVTDASVRYGQYFVAFKGSAKGEEIQEILFIEVKTGSSQLSTREKSIKELIQQGKIRYIEYRIPSLEE